VHQDGVCTAGDNFAYRFPHIRQARDRADRDTVVHWNDYGFSRISVDYSFDSYLFAYHY
jgi:hypothetical protein